MRNLPNPRTLSRRTRWLVGAGVIAGITAVAVIAAVLFQDSGSGPDKSRALTADEANRLAITRFRNYETGGRSVRITVPDVAGGLVVTASVDFRSKLAYGVIRGEGRNSSSDGLVQWTPTVVSVAPLADAPDQAPTTPPATGWSSRPLQANGSALDSALRIALGLGNDRPDNAQLLPQNGASWLGQETVNGHEVARMSGPGARDRPDTQGTVHYWIAGDGTMYRVQVSVASDPQPVVIDFDTRPYTPVKPLPR
ncbi:hypothetical protein GCM10009804_38610 [Kribbella hippodromi]|uniref:Uncharacterized protein n=1 Tax=Kribbella hippodromi TaxID=434347 RepID=A0ABP4PDN4_9ACTN